MSGNLIDRMITLNSRLQSIPVRFGVPQYRDLMVRHAELSDDLLGDRTDTLFAPKPQISSVPTKLVGLDLGGGAAFQSSGSITIAQDDFQVTGIPRSYSLEFLREGVEFYVVDPLLVNGAIAYDSKGNPAGGIFCKLLAVTDRELLTWSLILRRLKDHYHDPESFPINY